MAGDKQQDLRRIPNFGVAVRTHWSGAYLPNTYAAYATSFRPRSTRPPSFVTSPSPSRCGRGQRRSRMGCYPLRALDEAFPREKEHGRQCPECTNVRRNTRCPDSLEIPAISRIRGANHDASHLPSKTNLPEMNDCCLRRRRRTPREDRPRVLASFGLILAASRCCARCPNHARPHRKMAARANVRGLANHLRGRDQITETALTDP